MACLILSLRAAQRPASNPRTLVCSWVCPIYTPSRLHIHWWWWNKEFVPRRLRGLYEGTKDQNSIINTGAIKQRNMVLWRCDPCVQAIIRPNVWNRNVWKFGSFIVSVVFFYVRTTSAVPRTTSVFNVYRSTNLLLSIDVYFYMLTLHSM